MPETVLLSRTGEPIVAANGVFLHSRYDPRAEAERFAEALRLKNSPYAFLLIEPGFGYLAIALRLKHPRAKILIAHCSPFFRTQKTRPIGYDVDGEWHPDDEARFESFLENHIADYEAHAVRVVEWKPSVASYGTAALDLFSAASIFLKRAAANARTTALFGKKWLRNALSFAANATTPTAIVPGTGSVVVVAAGPSLEDSIEAIRAAQKGGEAFILCVASAISVLAARGIRADAAVATDGGGWAAFHLFEVARSGVPLAVALNAALPSGLLDSTLLPIRDTSLWQETATRACGLFSIPIPQRGTVAATALDLALSITSGKVFLAGFDFGLSRGRTHAKPNALDRFHEDWATRLIPADSAAYARYLATRDGGVLGIYADWMTERLRSYPDRLRVLTAASKALESLPVVERITGGPGEILPKIEAIPRTRVGSTSRREAVVDTLWRAAQFDYSRFKNRETPPRSLLGDGSVAGELISLLFPSELESAAAGRSSEEGILRFLMDSEIRLGNALSVLARERRWTND